MHVRLTRAAAGCLVAAWILAAANPPATVADLQRAFAHPPDDARIMVRWWWFGPAVVKSELERELRAMREGGIGGVEVQPVYPLTLDDPPRGLRNLPYLSDEFLDQLRFASAKAQELGLRMDLTLGSGWPYGGPHIPAALASARLRVERVAVDAKAAAVPVPKMQDGEKLIAAFLDASRLDIVDGGARVRDSAGEGRVVLFFISSRTHQMVKRAAVGAEGLVLDHYDRAATERHLKLVGDRLMQAFSQPPYAVFSDSLEAYGADWSGDLLAEFQRRRGYDLTPYLPALSSDTGGEAAAIRHDWGQTLTELANENYLTPIRQWAHEHGTRFRSQTYGTPPVNLASNDLVDLPEGEGSDWRRFTATRWAASASHLYERPVTSSETWTWLHSPVFRATPLDMKAEADRHFLEGVNQLMGHGWPYSPPEAGEPGWHFYAAAVFNDHNPWWLVMPDIALYLQRVSFLLRQGRPAADVALYLPTDDAYARFSLGHASVNDAMGALLGPTVIPQILDAGYSFDFIDDGAIARRGIPYPILILPGVERIPPATYRKIAEYLREGGTAIAARRAPSLAPGFKDAETGTLEVRALSRALFEQSARGKLVTDETRLGEALRAALAPEVSKAPEIGFVHRKLPFADLYFLANTSNHRVRSQAAFRVAGPNAAWWDPFTGKITRAGGASRVELDFAPYESRILVFSKEQAARAPDFPAPAAIDLSGTWQVTFADSPRPVTMPRLIPWTEVEGKRFFSGQATYEKTVAIDARLVRARRPLYLDFGEGTPVDAPQRQSGPGMRALLESPVRECAVVYVNGRRAGAVWHPPYEVEVTGLLHAGENRIRVVVANLAFNRMAQEPPPDYAALIARFGDRFQDQDMRNLQPLPAGILGPVRLIVR